MPPEIEIAIRSGRRIRVRSGGFSLLEIMVALAIAALLAGLSAPRFLESMNSAKVNACHIQKGKIEIQAERWRRDHGRWPRSDLREMTDDTKYFPDGAYRCPLSGESYQLDAATHRVPGHDH